MKGPRVFALLVCFLGLPVIAFFPLNVQAVGPRNIATLEGHTDSVTSVAYGPNGKTLVSGSADNTVKLWDIALAKNTASFKGAAFVSSVLFTADGKTVAAGGGDGTIRLWTISTGKNLRTFEGHTAAVLSLALSPDGKILASASRDRTIKLWDLASGKNTTTLEGHVAEVRAVAFSPDGKLLASVSPDKSIRLWDVASGKNTAKLQEGKHTYESSAIAFSPDGKTLATQVGGAIRLWDIATGKGTRNLMGQILMGQEIDIMSLSFSPDGKWIAAGDRTGTVMLWNVSNGQRIANLKGHTGPVLSVAFSPDGKTFASAGGGKDNTIKLWTDVSDEASELRVLLKEQRKSLKNVVELLTTQFSEGKVDLSRVLRAQRDLLKASLELYNTPKERIEALDECMQTAKQFVAGIGQKVKAGLCTAVDELEAKVVLREIQIELLRAELQRKREK